MLGYAWPGNVRELAHELERAIVFEEGDELNFEHLRSGGRDLARGDKKDADWLNENFTFPEEGFLLEEAINRLIQKALMQSGDNVSGGGASAGRFAGLRSLSVGGQKRRRLIGDLTPFQIFKSGCISPIGRGAATRVFHANCKVY